MSAPDALIELDGEGAAWGAGLWPVACAGCGDGWLVPEAHRSAPCPCGRGTLGPAPARLPTAPPEDHVPLQVDRAALARALARHLGTPWFRLEDPEGLARRARLIWWPRWLVDADVTGPWTAEVGFDYQARSSVERLVGSQWTRQHEIETRVRWEPRMGRLSRRYDNVVVPGRRSAPPTAHDPGHAPTPRPGLPADPDGPWVQLPDLAPGEVVELADGPFRARAAADIAAACAGQHVRDVHLTPTYAGRTWTLRLQPTWVVACTTLEGSPYTLQVDGVTGRYWAPVLVSTARAWRWTGGLAAAGALVLVLTAVLGAVGLLLPPLLVLVAIVGLLGLGLMVASVVPIAQAWRHDRDQRRRYGLDGRRAAPAAR